MAACSHNDLRLIFFVSIFDTTLGNTSQSLSCTSTVLSNPPGLLEVFLGENATARTCSYIPAIPLLSCRFWGILESYRHRHRHQPQKVALP